MLLVVMMMKSRMIIAGPQLICNTQTTYLKTQGHFDYGQISNNT